MIEHNVRAESIAIDIHGNPTISRTIIERTTQTQTIDYPESTSDARTISVNGRVMASRSKTGITTTFDYDPLGRQTSATDRRTGPAISHFDEATGFASSQGLFRVSHWHYHS
ncbi:MAG: RHS repeat protein [Desulfobacteraceae bacterium]|nr:RHS repeat protein [Desulfobacteraceae bacterium]